jgi:hypothetical protein
MMSGLASRRHPAAEVEMERRRVRWAVGTVAAMLVSLVLPGIVLGAGPVRAANGEPDNDTQLSVLTPAEAAFVSRKLAMAARIGGAATPSKTADLLAPMYACELDPCEGDPTWPPPGGPSPAKTLGTKARQQNNYYYCGPATGQVVINWTRGITSGNNDGEDVTTNWRRQSKIATWMNTTTAGTGGANLAIGLNNPNGVLKPTSDWVYTYADNGTVDQFHKKVITDIDGFGMPLVLATAPHVAKAGVNYLSSWPKEYPNAHHWIVVRGYDGLPGSSSPVIRYQDSSAGFGGATGPFSDSLAVIYQVSKSNQGGHVVW